MEFIRPMVEDRFARMEEFGEDWDNKPVRLPLSFNANVIIITRLQNDMLMWLMDEAKGVEKSLAGVARRMLVVNFAAIHTSSNVSHTDSDFFMSY
jgi:hypothetical protein